MIRAALWFVGLFALAVAIALFAGNNEGMVSLFWSPYRVDISLNMLLLALLATFAIGYAALRAFSALLMLPQNAKRWRQQQKERQMYQAFVESFSHLQAGRYVRASKSAQTLLKLSDELRNEHAKVPQDSTMRAIAHMFAADSAHALRNVEERDSHYAQALEDVPLNGSQQQQEVREGAQMRAARWALDDRDPQEALRRLDQLAPGAKRRTMALRIKLKAGRLAREVQTSLETARLLYKHGGLSTEAASGIVRSLLQEQLHDTHDSAQVQQLWSDLPSVERQDADIVLSFAQRWLHVGGDSTTARSWLLPLWERYVQSPDRCMQASSNASSCACSRRWKIWMQTGWHALNPPSALRHRMRCCSIWPVWPVCSASCGARASNCCARRCSACRSPHCAPRAGKPWPCWPSSAKTMPQPPMPGAKPRCSRRHDFQNHSYQGFMHLRWNPLQRKTMPHPD